MDYLKLWQYSTRFAFAGYLVGLFIKRPFTLALLFPVPFIVKFIIDEYELKRQGKYQGMYEYRNW